ncbi:MAG: hypothetical protein ACYS9X_13515 [Planctomycetota bacterium]
MAQPLNPSEGAEVNEGPGGLRRPAAPRDSRAFRFPIGLDMLEGENYRQREGYDVSYLKDEELPRYQYTVAVGADSVGRAFLELAGCLPEEVRVVLEVPGGEERGRDVCEVWTGPPTRRDLFVRAFREHERLFVHDGLVGYGAVSADRLTELFLDEHKLIYFFTRDMDGPDAVLARLGVPALPRVRHFSELGHVHTSLCGKGEGEPYWEVAEELGRALGLEWEETKEYS